ncbi:MAG: NADP-dependent isocitrate dehydrogenase [Campylobacteraceae bacterium]
MATIYYTKTDESPLIATYSLFPIFKAFTRSANINFEMKDLSLSGRILATFCNYPDDLKFLGDLTHKKDANIIKLPNISASIVQLKSAIKELQLQGFDVPDFIDEPKNENEKTIKEKYSKVLGSAVNPVLREGNSDRRAAKAVKNYAKNNPHKMGEWNKDSKTRVSSMSEGDFYENEQSYLAKADTKFTISFTCKDGKTKVLKENLVILKDEIVDCTYLSVKKLKSFIKKELENTKKDNTLLSLHLKATMMKVSDPVIFGTAVEVYFDELFKKHQKTFLEIGYNPNNGLGDLHVKIASLSKEKQEEILNDIKAIYTKNPDLSMVDSDKGVTNLHVPNDVIVDASMPAMIRNGGKLWDKDGKTRDTNALIPDRSYAGIYQVVIEDCKLNGALNPSIIGSVSNIGLMAKKAEEYGSHDKTFMASGDGKFVVKDTSNNTIFEVEVENGDIFRMCQVKDDVVKDWIKLAVNSAKNRNLPAIFWLDNKRAHDRAIIKKVEENLKDYDLSGLDIKILSPIEATKLSLKRMREGKDTISVTGNVLRDYLTDLFPIIELGTSAKMLSIVPLMSGGGLFETGAGGSAPKQVEQFVNENHLRWDSLGEFLAVFSSLEFIGISENNKKALVLSKTLDKAIENVLLNNKSPKQKAKEIDNRGSHFYLSLYWAKELSSQKDDLVLEEKFKPVYEKLSKNEEMISSSLLENQGVKLDIKGYYNPSDEVLEKAMRPNKTFNEIIDAIN